MTALSVQPPFPILTDIDGQPLDDGFIFIGVVNLAPITNPITVYWDAALSVTATQPIRTRGGYPMNAGVPGRLYVNSDYSIQVQNRNGSVVYSAPEATEALGNIISFADITGTLGSDRVTFLQAGSGAVTRTAQAKMRDTVSVKDFGAVGDGVADDTVAIQAALNSAPPAGLRLYFPAGTYKTTAPLIPKVVIPSPAFSYNLTVFGDGPSVSTIKAFHSGNVFTITQGQASFTGRDSNLFFNMLSISGNYQASHCIYADYIAGMKLVDCIFSNANTAQVRIGVNPASESYGIDIRNCYMNSNADNSGQAIAGLHLFQARYVLIDRLTTDGAGYGIFMDGCDKGFIVNCHLEGAKIAALWIQGTGGGEHKIANNMFFPYVFFDASAKFDGTLYGLYMTGSAGGNTCNNIVGNVFIVGQAGLPIKTTITGASGTLVANPGFLVTGGTSGATGTLDGYVSSSGKALIRVASGTFQAAEVITQASTGGTGTLGAIVNPDSVGLFTSGSSGYHNIVGNQFRIQPKTGIVLAATGCNVSENVVPVASGGTAIYKDAPIANIIGNTLEAPTGNAFWNFSGTVNFVANQILSGALPGLTSANELGEISILDNFLQRTAGDFIQTLRRGSTDLFKLSNNGTGNVHLAGCNGATIWLGSSNTGSRTSSTIGVNGSGQLVTLGIPTSSAGLPSGAVWSNSGVLTVV